MILLNYWKAMHSLKDVMLTTGQSSVIDYGMIGLDGNNYGAINMGWDNWGNRDAVWHNARLRSADISMRVGTGTGEISPDDYSLFNDCTSSISNLNVTNTLEESETGYKQTVTLTGKNNSANTLTITEAGITKTFYGHPDAKSPLLLVKTLLDTPIEVEPQGNFTITLEWNET
jgi:hypothetical protein